MENPARPTNPNANSNEEVEHPTAEADGVIGAAGYPVTNPVCWS